MPFEPRIYDDPPGQEPVWDDAAQLDLPDDLAALAEQLRDDANYLARQHPADATPAQRQAAWEAHVEGDKSESRRFAGLPWRWMSAAAAVLIAVAGGALAWRLFDAPNDTPHSLVVTDREAEALQANAQNPTGNRDVVASESPTRRGESIHRKNPAASDELPSDTPRLIPATFLRDVSGPELDGMLDLLEEDESGLSI